VLKQVSIIGIKDDQFLFLLKNNTRHKIGKMTLKN